jgi:hypothetical protein
MPGKEEKQQHIIRNFDGSPTIFSDVIEENCLFENTLVEGLATIVIDKTFLDEMYKLTDSLNLSRKLIQDMSTVTRLVIDYFFSNDNNDLSRKETYGKNYITDEDGMIIGTKLSSLKGKNIAECSEKSLAGFVVLKKLYDEKKIKSKPSFMLSELKPENGEFEPHAFILLDRESDQYPIRHLLFDIHNLSQIEIDGEVHNMVGLYSLTDEEYNKLINGESITPTSLFESAGNEYKDVGLKRTFGSSSINKSY